MSLTTTAPLSLPPHPNDRAHPSMSYPQADDRAYQGYYSRPAPGSAHGAPAPDASSPERLHSAGGPYAKTIPPHGVPPQSPSHAYPQQELGPAPGSSHGYPPQQPITPLSGSAGYPPQAPPQPYYGVAGGGQDPNLPSPPAGPGSRPGTAGYTQEGAPIVPVGISGGKMFRCRGFGECDKVFTRSEHLARHVRKHTGERPFPCHCGKAFSRLDNLRQHAATVHADQTQLNEAMLTSLASVHAALSQRANREQRRRGEVVEVPKNAVERPRGDRNSKNPQGVPGGVPPPGGVYPPGPGYHQPHGGWAPPPEHGGRPRTAGSWVEYPRPPSSAGGHPYPAGYYEQGPPPSSHGRPPTANAPPGTAGSDDSSQVAYPYRPVSSNGPGVPPAGNWTSPPTPHAGYPPSDPSLYPQGSVPPPDGQHPYPSEHAQGGAGYGPPPPGSSGGYYYPAQQGGQGYYGQQSPAQQHPATFSSVPPPAGGAPPAQSYPPNYNGQQSDSPFQYNAPPGGSYTYPPGGYDQRKRRSDDDSVDARKHPRASNEAAPPSGEPRAPGQPGQDPLWLPPTAERRSSLAISALLGSPQQEQRSRPSTGDMPPGGQPPAGYAYYQDDRQGGQVPGGIRGGERPGDRKPKALVAE